MAALNHRDRVLRATGRSGQVGLAPTPPMTQHAHDPAHAEIVHGAIVKARTYRPLIRRRRPRTGRSAQEWETLSARPRAAAGCRRLIRRLI